MHSACGQAASRAKAEGNRKCSYIGGRRVQTTVLGRCYNLTPSVAFNWQNSPIILHSKREKRRNEIALYYLAFPKSPQQTNIWDLMRHTNRVVNHIPTSSTTACDVERKERKEAKQDLLRSKFFLFPLCTKQTYDTNGGGPSIPKSELESVSKSRDRYFPGN